MKSKIMILGIDDSPHHPDDLHRNNPSGEKKNVYLVGVTSRDIQLLHVSTYPVQIDGIDATNAVLQLYFQSPYYKQIRLIMINSPTVAGFNIIDPFQINNQIHVPVVLISNNQPKTNLITIFSKLFPQREEQFTILKRLGISHELKVRLRSDPNQTGKIYYHIIGLTEQEIVPLLHNLCYYSALSEPLRLAHIIASSYFQ